MGNQSTGPDASGDVGAPDYAAKYNGLQRVFQTRTNEWSAKEADYEAKISDLEARSARLAEIEAAEAAAAEEQEFDRQARERGYGIAPTPLKHGSRDVTADSRTGGDDGSLASLREQVASGRMFTGKPTKLTGWPT